MIVYMNSTQVSGQVFSAIYIDFRTFKFLFIMKKM